jgi:hypothetical protein
MTRIKQLNTEEKLIYLNFLKRSLNEIPIPEIADLLEKNNKSIEQLKELLDEYPFLNIINQLLNDEIDDLNLKLFKGEIKLGQDLKYFPQYFAKTKITNKNVSKDGEKIELTCYSESLSMSKEIISVVCRFENNKLVSFDDKRDKTFDGTLKKTKEEIIHYAFFDANETLEFIKLNDLANGIDGKDLAHLILLADFKYSVEKIHLMKNFRVTQFVEEEDLIKIIKKSYYDLDRFIGGLENDLIKALPINKIIQSYLDELSEEYLKLFNHFKNQIDNWNGGTILTDGSSLLLPYRASSYYFAPSKTTDKWRNYRSDDFGLSIYNLNEILDDFIKQLNYHREFNISKLKTLGIPNDVIFSIEKKFDEFSLKYNELKKLNKNAASSATERQKNEKRKQMEKKLIKYWLIALILYILYLMGWFYRNP